MDKEQAIMEFANAVASTRLEGDRALSLWDIADVLYKELGTDVESVIKRLNYLNDEHRL